jgi:hypothetical protein
VTVTARLIGGPADGRIMTLGSPLSVLRYPKPKQASAFHPETSTQPPMVSALDVVEYVPTGVRHHDGAYEYLERSVFAAARKAAVTGARRDLLTAEAVRRWDAAPDLRRLHDEPNVMGRVWTCGDCCCCSQAEVIGWTGAHTIDGADAVWPTPGELTIPYARSARAMTVRLWQGRFFTDGGHDRAADDLLFLRRYLDEFAPVLAQRMQWETT